MRRQATVSPGVGQDINAGAFRMIPLAELDPPPSNTRTHFKEDSLDELTRSIKEKGVLQPILVRQVEAPGGKGVRFQIIAGERRFRASLRAELSEIPAHIKPMSDTEALDAQLVENLQREDVHPLDEADGFLRLKEVLNLEISDVAQRVAKHVRYVARRLALTNLIEEAREDLRSELITLAHALEICRLSPEIQVQALAACYETRSIWNQKAHTYTYKPNKERPARHVKQLQAWIEQNVHLNLHKAPFKLDDARLRADGLTCVECPQRTGRDKSLFDDIKNDDTCLNPPCFHAKIEAFVQIRKGELDAKGDKPAAYISPVYGSSQNAKGALGLSDYKLLEKKADRCEYAEQAVYSEGTEVGQVRWICREKTCKDHLGRVRASHSSSTGGSSRAGASPADRNKRKQEIFDIKVDDIVRKRVMKEAIKTYKWPLGRAHLNEVVKEFFRRIPTYDQRTICEVFGWDDDLAGNFRLNDGKVLAEIAKLDDGRLAQFLMLCSFAHYGANEYKHRQVDQKLIVGLSKERGVNHTLIDAQVRAELAAKKYKTAHQSYLDAVVRGEVAEKPVVYEKPPQKGKPKAARKKASPTTERGASKKTKTAAQRAHTASNKTRGRSGQRSAKAGTGKQKIKRE